MAVKTIEWKNNKVILLDQRLLPDKEVYRSYREYTELARAIRDMVIRGAPAIGVAAAMGVALGALWVKGKNFDREVERIFAVFAKTRPTAVNLFWALERMRRVYAENRSQGVDSVKRLLKEEAQKIYDEDIAANRLLGRFGAKLLRNGSHVLTTCNAGALATAGYGTALGVIRAMKDSGKHVEVLVNETRPYLQGARLTAWELKKDKIPVTLLTDNMVGIVMQRNNLDAVIVGCDRVAANGDVANKIGTYTIAVLAHRHKVPFYVACPTSTIDPKCPTGAGIPIEERDVREVSHIFGRPITPRGVRIMNPALQVVRNGSHVLTTCNAGALATAGYGTALGVIRAMKDSGKQVEVLVNETRPYLQGARLTAWELKKDKIPVTLLTDNMVGIVMQRNNLDAVIVGCDRVAANGDVANKIGTYTIAVLAHRHKVPFYVACPTSTIDPKCPTGAGIPIEERDVREVSHIFGRPITPRGVRIMNPAFDITHHELISALITERGVITPPFGQNIRAHVRYS